MEHLRTSIIVLFLFCSPWPSAGKTFLTHLGMPCTEDCEPDGGEYKCKTIDEDGRSTTLYCSPQENMDYWGRQCRSDSMCGKHGEGYWWCRISIFAWGYCGLVKDNKIIESGEDTHIVSQQRNRRDTYLIDKVDDKANHKLSTFRAEPAPEVIADGSKFRNEAENLIGSWDNGKLRDKATSNLIKSENLRIDMQGTFPYNNLQWYNLQIQINKPRARGESTTVAQVFVSQDIVPIDRYVRRALQESLDRRARVFVQVTQY